jgi:hypothetical protein
MNNVLDSVPETPKVLDKIFNDNQNKNLLEIKLKSNDIKEGYRLQIFESTSVSKANKKMLKFKKILGDSLYMSFEAPYYKIQYGNFSKREDAEREKKSIAKKGFKNVWIIRSRIL